MSISIRGLGALVCVLSISACDASRPAVPRDAGPPESDGAPDVDAQGDGEICDNGIDDDGDARVDEGCGCELGATRSCYEGDPALENIGGCIHGLQRCTLEGEFGTWSPCEGSGAPTAELCNAVDDDCDGATDEEAGEGCACEVGETRDCFETRAGELGSGTPGVGRCAMGRQRCSVVSAGVSGWGACQGAIVGEPEQCDDGIDDDCDGEVDEDCGVCPPTRLTWEISAEEMASGASDRTGPGACTGIVYFSSSGSTTPPDGCGSPHCGTLRYGDGRLRAMYCTVYGACERGVPVATGFGW